MEVFLLKGPEAPGQVYSLPLGFGRVRPAASQPYPSAGVHGLPEAIGQLHSPHLAFERARPAASHSYPSAGVHSIYCSSSNTAYVDVLKEEVITLKGKLAVQGKQMMAQGEELKACVVHVRDLVRTIQMIGIQISLPVPDLTPPSTSEPLHLEDSM
ncbi:hypothetical protein DVH24_000912 [Malus domestica]|uniref:Uncharacterized protein n=1 Tax=Malus domestica TaxID=3750 RepID=A0A498K073_MALDO|nr:hypothetical protein DVH24_000912 [Malus domestica]